VRTGLVALLAACALLFAGAAGASAVGNGKIAFFRAGAILVVKPDGSGEATLVANAGQCAHPVAWSADGTKLLYVKTDSPSCAAPTLSVVNADGTGAHELLSDNSRAWSPVCWLGNDEVAVLGTLETSAGASRDLWAVKADGTGLRRITTDGGDKRVAGPQACSADGSRVAYSRFEGSPNPARAYWVSAAGGEPVSLGTPEGASDNIAVMSPDGAHVALVRSSSYPLLVVDLAAGRTRPVTTAPASSAPSWSPDSSHLVFQYPHILGYTRFGAEQEFDLREGAADGSGERDLTTTLNAQESEPSWSPDGTRVLFVSTRGMPANPWLMNADGSCPTAVTTGGGEAPVWQPVPGAGPAAPLQCADLAVSGYVGPFTVVASGQQFTATFTVTNLGNETATNPVLQLPALPAQSELVSILVGTVGESCSTETRICALPPLAPGAQATVTFELRSTVPASSSIETFVLPGVTGSAPTTELRVTATATAAQPDGDRSNNDADATELAVPCTQVTAYSFALKGTAGDDVLCGLTGAQRLYGRAGEDTLVGGPGFDFLDGGPGHDVLLGGGENDVVVASDGTRDVVDCGGSARDVAVVDRRDKVVNCEVVDRPRVHCARIGTIGSDRLSGTAKGDVLCGLQGSDTIEGLAGEDQIDGGQGNDTIDGGPGRDRIFGGAGYDVVLARDGVRDRIDCGTELDTVIADRLDRVAANCEHVQRPG
jgi:uncharacterized repeat protein (TIGR01451 family)